MNQPPLEISSLSAIEHLLQHKPERITRLQIDPTAVKRNPRVERLTQLARSEKVSTNFGTTDVKGEPVKAWLHPFTYQTVNDLLEFTADKPKSLIVALDHLQDPQNFGAITRTAEGLGADGILLPKDRGVLVTSGVYHASVGAVDTIPVCLVTNLGDGLRKLKEAGYWIVGTSLSENSTAPEEVPTFDKVVLVLGAELEGLSSGIEKTCDWLVKLPLKGRVQSLNVSAAAAIFLHFFTNRLNR